MTVFADSSAVVASYADEPGGGVLASSSAVAVSALARVEVSSAFWRKHRLGELDAEQALMLSRRFERDLRGTTDGPPRYAIVGAGWAVLGEAAALAASAGLRAYDAMQLASAMAARRAAPTIGSFACLDTRLRDAAAAHGFRLIPGS